MNKKLKILCMTESTVQTTSFDMLEDVAKAAKEAEDYLKSVALMQTHHIIHIRVNARYKGTRMPRGAQFLDSNGKADSNAACTKKRFRMFQLRIN
jgi:hypothetical protein